MALVRPTQVLNQGGLFVIDGLPAIPEIAELFPATRRWHESKLRPHGTAAAWRREQRRKSGHCDKCRAWRKAYDAARPAESRR